MIRHPPRSTLFPSPPLFRSPWLARIVVNSPCWLTATSNGTASSPIHHQPHIGASSSPSTRSVLWRSEEHTSELQSQSNLVCRLLLEKKKMITQHAHCL